MSDKRADFLSKINEEAVWQYSAHRKLRYLQMFLMIAIAVAGVFTANEGASGLKGLPYLSPFVLLVCGIVSAVCAAINQWANPERRSAEHRNIKMALRAVEGAVKNRKFSLAKAEQLKTLAFKNPEAVIEKLSGGAD